MYATKPRSCAVTSALAFALLFAVANAPAITKAPARGTNATPTHPVAAPAAPTTSPLTPTAAVSSPVPPAGEDIRDIRQPRHAHTPWFWVIVAVGVALLTGGALAVWHWLRHGKYFELTPAEIALQHLAEARRLLDPEQAREYGFAVSKIIRGYIEEQWQLHAPRLTTEEFLRELVEGSETIVAPQRALLGDFLQHCDLAKFAGWRYSLPALAELHDSAIAFVQQSSASAVETHPDNATAITSSPASATEPKLQPARKP